MKASMADLEEPASGAQSAAGPALPGWRAQLREARRLVVKLGTNVLSRESGELALGRIHTIIEEVVDLSRAGRQVIVVSSGAISLGMERLKIQERPTLLADKQACAAVGQIRLMAVYQAAFDRYGIATAQILLTEEDFNERGRYLNLRNTLQRLLQLGVVPIVNENDTVSTSEIETYVERPNGSDRTAVFGDNDTLSALVAAKLDADVLVLLTDTDGLYSTLPDDPAAVRFPLVEEVTPEIENLARGGSARGRGGMRTKLRAARIAARSGVLSVIARGSDAAVLRRIFQGEEVGTVFLPRPGLSGKKHWIAFATSVAGRVRVNAGAREALVERRASLLFAGVTALEAEFRRGEVVSITDEAGVEFARGVVNYSRAEAEPLVGKRSPEIKDRLAGGLGELITRDNIVIL
jgi:glutamate 5-kinase